MRLIGDKLLVEWDKDHNKVFGKGINGVDIIRPDFWLNTEAVQTDGGVSRFEDNVNYLETNPQIATVVHASTSHGYKPGDKLFLNYMAYEWTEKTEGGYIIDTDFILFQILPTGDLKLVDDVYIGEIVHQREEKVSGFVVLRERKDSLKIKILYAPANHREQMGFGIGSTVISIDKNNYEFNYNSKKYIKLTRIEIVTSLIN